MRPEPSDVVLTDAARLQEDIAAYGPRLARRAYALTRNADEASDLAQETLARAIAAAQRLRPDSDLRAWLTTILNNLYRKRRRARWHVISFDHLEEHQLTQADAIASVEREALGRASLAEIARAFRRLPRIYADAIRLVAVEDLSYLETAKRLGVPVGTVMSRVYRGRRLLLRWLSEGSE